MITIHFIIIIFAIICFFLAAINVPSKINLVALGLLFWLISTLIH